jgi:translation initiation factor IF-2
MRVHELAKDLGIPSKDILAKLHELGVDAKNHMSALDDAAVAHVREAISKPAPAKAPEAKKNAAKPSAAKKESAKVETPPKKTEEAPPPPKPAEKAPEKAPAKATAKAAAPAKEKSPVPPAAAATPPPTTGAAEKIIRIRGPIIVKDLAESIGIRPNKLIAELMSLNILASINEHVDANVAKKVAEKHGFTLEHERRGTEHVAVKKSPEAETEEEDRPEDLVPRPPVVTFMGHVDHGKTSLMDRIRHTAVAKGEHGGITQHIGAYTVELSGRRITFLDTPGHAAFTAMRARGANLTDIAVIIIAADDGIMPQTKEAVKHAKAAEVAIMVAINKIDLPAANVMRVKQQLQGEGLAPEDWGGTTICAPVSAQTGEGIDHLLEMILLQADVLELKANPNRRAKGYVIEAQMEPGMGPTANLLITTGTLKVGDAIVCGPYYGKVRALINDRGAKVVSASPGTAIKCLGLSGVPEAGADFHICPNEKVARAQAQETEARLRQEQTIAPKKASLEDLFAKMEESKKQELKIILKADTQGSVEAISHALQEIKSEKISLNIVLSGTGNITENDVMLGSASNAVILGFHVAKEPGVDAAAKHEGVSIHLHQIIYEMIDKVRDAMTGLLAPEIKEKIMGHALVKQTFPISKGGKAAGCLVTSGSVRPRFKVRVKRGAEALFEGSILSLKRFQDSASEVKEDQECGIRLDKFSDFEEGDILEFYELEEITQTL